MHPDDVRQNSPRSGFRLAVSVVTSPYVPLERSLQQLGFEDIVPFYDLAESFRGMHPLSNGWFAAPLSAKDQENTAEVLALWDDDMSRAHHLQFLAWRRLREEWTFDAAPIRIAPGFSFRKWQASSTTMKFLLDAGAHHGSVSQAFVQQTKGAFRQIVAIEPDPSNRARLEANLRSWLPDDARVTVYDCALAEEEGEALFHDGLDYASQLSQTGRMRVDDTPARCARTFAHLRQASSRRRRARRAEGRPGDAAGQPPHRRGDRLSQRRRHLENAALADGNVARLSVFVPRPFLVRHRRRGLRHTARAARGMIPNIDALASVADDISKSVPEGLTRGEVNAGLYGLGFLGRWALPRLRRGGVKLVSCYDANEALKGTFADGLPIYSASELKRAAPEFMVVTARHAVAPVSAMLADLGIAHVSYDAWHVALNFEAFRHVHDCVLGDDHSKEVMRAVLMAMLTGRNRFCDAVFEKDQYFCLPQFSGSEKEFYVDAGAYVGDSTERFIWSQNGVFFEDICFRTWSPPICCIAGPHRATD